MDHAYIESLTREDRVAAGISVFIRLWLNGMTRSVIGRDWTIAQLAMLFEVTQAYQYRDEPHTITSLADELRMPVQTVSRQIREFNALGIVRQRKSSKDARVRYLIPSKRYSGLHDLNRIIDTFGKHWYRGDSWSKLDKAKGALWYCPMDICSDTVAQKQMQRLKKIVKKRRDSGAA